MRVGKNPLTETDAGILGPATDGEERTDMLKKGHGGIRKRAFLKRRRKRPSIKGLRGRKHRPANIREENSNGSQRQQRAKSAKLG